MTTNSTTTTDIQAAKLEHAFHALVFVLTGDGRRNSTNEELTIHAEEYGVDRAALNAKYEAWAARQPMSRFDAARKSAFWMLAAFPTSIEEAVNDAARIHNLPRAQRQMLLDSILGS